MSNREMRFCTAPVQIEKRENQSGKITGLAAVYDQRTQVMFWDEEIAPGAFDNADMSDVRALFNHDSNQVLGRTKSGTLTLERTSEGLAYTIDPPDTTFANDLMVSMKRGDIDQSSFAFVVKEQEWIERKGERELRRITEVEAVYDVSPVTYPAYDGTTSEARSLMNLDVVLKDRIPDKEQRRQFMLDADLFFVNHLSAHGKNRSG